MTPREEWRPVLGWPEYEASSQGRVRSLDRIVRRAGGRDFFKPGRILRPAANHRGHLTVVLCRPGERLTVLVHRLVAEAFLGPRPPGLNVCHNNDVKTDNRIENLRFDTPSENARDRTRNGIHNFGNRTHCSAGHEYTPENTHRLASGERRCRTCAAARARRYKRAKKEAVQ